MNPTASLLIVEFFPTIPHNLYLEVEVVPRLKDTSVILLNNFICVHNPEFLFQTVKERNFNPCGLCCLMVRVILENHQWHNFMNGNSGYEQAKSICCCYDAWKLFTH